MASENIMKQRVNEMVDTFVPLIASSNEGKELPGVNLSGPPGVGKSDGIREIAKQLSKQTGKEVVITDVRLLNFAPTDIRGIPAKDEQKTIILDDNDNEKEITEQVARWLKPSIFNMSHAKNIINILFLDEITAAPQSVQAAAYQLVLDRKVGEHVLPKNCFVFCAGNRITDKSVAYKMPKALANRLCHLEIYAEVDDWKRWAINTGIDQRILGFINYQNSALFDFEPSNDDLAFPTPRSWSMVDKFLKKLKSVDAAFPLIAGCIGLGAATNFKGYTKVYADLPNIQDIFDGKDVKVPKAPDVNFALSSALVSYAPKANKKQLANLLAFTLKDGFQAEYATLTIKDIVVMEDVRSKILTLPEWIQWSKKYKSFIM